jgi:hypothetical protein
MTMAGLETESPPATAPAVTVKERARPHDDRIVAHYAQYQTAVDKYVSQRLVSLIYADVQALSAIIMMKKYGFSPRIDFEAITHEVATSAIMTVILRNKVVDSWTNLIRKITSDLSNKWMRVNLYSPAALMSSLDEGHEDEDGESSSVTADVPCHDMDPSMVYSYYNFLHSRVEKTVAIMRQIGDNVKSRMIARMALSHALGILPPGALSLVPPVQRARIQYYSYNMISALRPVLSAKHFEREFL